MVVGARYWDGMSWLALVNAPTGFLDVRLQAQLPGLLRGPVRNPGLSLIIATHDLAKMNGGRGSARASPRAGWPPPFPGQPNSTRLDRETMRLCGSLQITVLTQCLA